MSYEFDWKNYILQLGPLPPLVQLWELELVVELKRWIPRREETTVLEVGCSNGRWLRWLEREYGAQIIGVDTNPVGAQMVENFVLADGLHLPFGDGTFDVVFSMGLVEHFAKAALRRKLIEEHVRVTKPRVGIVWLEHPNMNISFSWLWTKLHYDRRLGYRHYRITHLETKEHFRNLGVEILAARFIGWFLPQLVKVVTRKLHKQFCFPRKVLEGTFQHKIFEHSLTADSFLVIGRRT